MSAEQAVDAGAPAMHVVATAGHVDHGKSALLKALTGQEPDRWDEERRRGLTIDLGYVWTTLTDGSGAEQTVAFVDVPGHDGFLTNMLSGVGVVEQVLFVVAADDGWSAQSEEHREILDLLGRRAVAAVVTKADLAGPDRTAEVVADVGDRLGVTTMADAPVVAVDSLSGTGLDTLRTTLATRLAETQPTGASAEAGGDATPRMWVDRAFTVTGAGTVVTGLLVAGHLAVGDEVVLAPSGRRGRIRGLQCLGESVRAAGATSRVAVNLAGVDADQVARGDVVTAPVDTAAAAARMTRSVDAHVRALPHQPIGQKGAWHLHVGTATTTVVVRPLLGDIDPGEEGHVRLELTDPLALRVGDRFVLREAGRQRTIGGGVVLDPRPARRPRGAEARLSHALVLDELREAVAEGDVDAQVAALVAAHGGRRGQAELTGMFGAAVTAELTSGDAGLTLIGEVVVDQGQVAPWTDAMLAAGRDADPDHAVERAALVTAAAERGCPSELAPTLIERAVADGALRSYGGRVVHADHEARYLDAREARAQALLKLLEEDPWQPPGATEALRTVGMPSFELQALLDDAQVVAAGSLLFPASLVARAIELLRDGPGRGGEAFTAAQARDAWSCTRRAAMPLLEHLRAVGVTRFDGERHRLIEP